MASTSSLTLSQALLARAISHHHGSNSSSSSSLSTLSMPTLSGLKSLPIKLSTKFFHRSRRSAGFSCQGQAFVAEPATVDKTTDTSLVEKSMNMIRFLEMDAVEKANSGHRLGLPMGCAPMGHILYNEVIRYNPKNPYWFNRDCFVLSTGHGCMLKYAPPRPHIPTVCFALHNPLIGQQPLPQPSSASSSFLLNGIIAIIFIFFS